MLEKATINIQGKEYNFIKPYACDFIDIEDQCYEEEGFNEVKFKTLLLGLVSQKIKMDDLVKLTVDEVQMSSGDMVKLNPVDYATHKKIVGGFKKFSRTGMAKEALKCAGVTGNISLNNFTYEDVSRLADAFYGMYDDSELDEVVDEIATFCFPS
ncbi:MAG: hypothetical protein RR744_00045 [Cellulosilyticaceae bacterium]